MINMSVPTINQCLRSISNSLYKTMLFVGNFGRWMLQVDSRHAGTISKDWMRLFLVLGMLYVSSCHSFPFSSSNALLWLP